MCFLAMFLLLLENGRSSFKQTFFYFSIIFKMRKTLFWNPNTEAHICSKKDVHYPSPFVSTHLSNSRSVGCSSVIFLTWVWLITISFRLKCYFKILLRLDVQLNSLTRDFCRCILNNNSCSNQYIHASHHLNMSEVFRICAFFSYVTMWRLWSRIEKKLIMQ